MPTTSQMPLLLGHRGAKHYAPENTKKAFSLCEKHGCDGFEFDVRLTSDGHAVCCHDPIWNDKDVNKTPAAELELETLSAALSFGERLYLDIEMKVAGIVPKLAFVLRTLDAGRTIISSFLPEVIFETRLFVPNLRAGLICRTPEQLEDFDNTNADILIAHRSLIDSRLISRMHRLNKSVWAWTVNDSKSMRQFSEMGIDGIISDDTKLLANTLRGMAMRVGA